jgi:HSP20 family molecular chaperone IbpA
MAIGNLDVLFDDVTKAFTTPHTYYRKPQHRTPEYVQHKNDNGYRLEIPAIGASKDDVSVKVVDKMLKIVVKPSTDSAYARQFEENWLVPDNIDSESVSAKLVNGLLTVILNHKEPVTKKINVDVVVN